ncbi:fatty acyl-CoA reductase 1-like isoform X2 [Sitophilus oryzae]|uniref:Fatty acyl-CoA reductase n=1 Tax=Sitophilus oryzae TaxID=7048 RepID=A0A6J2XYE6_SITOR|nr:fatty acyl-CoA reductase 1-like isoform X2 [Sitophilus oryzae]
MENRNSVREFYKAKNIFITGATGFIGKALIEKLLRSCPDIHNLYALVRNKKGKTLKERREQLFSNPIFDLLRDNQPELFRKVLFIQGDVAEDNLGISGGDMKMLIENVHVVFHCAASVKFDDFLKDAIRTNLTSARDMALLALKMKKLDVFVHVSTAYCSISEGKTVPEELIPAIADWKETIYVAEKCDENLLNILSHKIVGKYPNTYTYTKHLADHCINELLGSKIPTVIVKPTIVTNSISEPMIGWGDNFNGPVGISIGNGFGVLRIFMADLNISMDYVPIDTVIKALILAGRNTAQSQSESSTSVDVIQPSAFGFKKYSLKLFAQLGQQVVHKYPLDMQIWYPNMTFTQSWIYYYINAVLFHLVPAICIDLLLRIFRYKPILFKIQRKIFIANLAVSYFTTHEWNFLNDKALRLFECLEDSEKEDFKYIVVNDNEHAYRYLKASLKTTKWLLLGQSKGTKSSAFKINKGFSSTLAETVQTKRLENESNKSAI